MPESLRGKRLLVVEEALKDFSGHWYEYVRAVADINREAGVQVAVVAHAGATEPLRRDLGAYPLFEKTMWDGVYRRGWLPLRKLAFVRHNWLVYRRMRQFLQRHGPFDCVFAPTVVVHHIWGWRLLLRLHRNSVGRMVLLIRNNIASYEPGSSEPRFDRAAGVFKRAIRSFAPEIASGRAVLATDSERLADEYRKLSGIAPLVFPSPRVAPAPARPTSRGAQAPIVFSCLGPARFEKGIDLLQQAIALYLADPAHPPARFVIQWNLPIVDAAGAPVEPDPALAGRAEVVFLREELDSGKYDRLLAESDCVVLPYRRASYFARISGVAVEAVTAGIPVIYTQDTWTGELVIRSGAGIAVSDGDVTGLVAAMATMARNYPEYRREAEARRGHALAEHSREAFLRKLWGLPEPEAGPG